MNVREFSIFNEPTFSESLGEAIFKDPKKFMQTIVRSPEWASLDVAKMLDKIDPLAHTAENFRIGDLIPFAGHSLGPVFNPVMDEIQKTATLQVKLHEGHFENAKENAHWFDCDKYKPGIAAAKELLGFEDDSEFVFTASGLSPNLAILMENFYRPGIKDWLFGKTRIIMLDTEIFSDQAVAVSVIKRAIQIANSLECDTGLHQSDAENLIIKIKPDQNGLFNTQTIIDTIRENAKYIQMIHLSDIVFGTGQRLELNKIFTHLSDVIEDQNIIVGLDLAHSVGNRPIDLKSLPVTFAVGCAYKHSCGFTDSFGIYVNQHVNLKKYPPLQGWKAADSNKVFNTINHYDDSIMTNKGALAFRTSNPPPVSLLPVQTYLTYFHKIGFNKCFSKSECLTQYMIAKLQRELGGKIDFITPLDPSQRGAMIVFQVKGITDVKTVEDFLKNTKGGLGAFEIDVRPPNNIRLTAHYAYTKFEQIHRMVNKLDLAINYVLSLQNENDYQIGMRSKL